ncbi:MAG: amino acid permease [marine benthic group bacterium]|nr:amino acid permease [Gemmatimonadota bacterium]MCL7976728.1 amino acid permease [Gemmatimonadota bacterium]
MTAMAQTGSDRRTGGHGFGTAPVFLASISTILGAILFLRFGYAVAHTGFIGTLGIVALGHAVTIPTALAIAEIATNRRVEGGGEYFIISRSFGQSIGGAIGIALYLSQAISVAFYLIAFAEAFRPLSPLIESWIGVGFDPRMISLPAIGLLLGLMLTRGASLGVAALWVVVCVLAVSLAAFLLGQAIPGAAVESPILFSQMSVKDPFMVVFAIVFPAFTGMTAGVGLSGDLAEPRKSIPLGIMAATVVGMLMYVLIAWKLATSAPTAMLADTERLVMSDIALWGPIIPIGLAAACVSSAIGSILVAPRTLQALARDRITPTEQGTRFLAAGVGELGEPKNATIVTAILAFFVAVLGDVDFVARIISMFFMVTYGSLCAISFLEHFAARPSYRPSFRSRWYISLAGALICLFLMFQMDPLYALLAIVVMAALYWGIQRSMDHEDDLGAIFQGVMTQMTRRLQIRLQKTPPDEWRPSIITVTDRTFDRSAPMQMLTWLSHRYGFGTYLHFIKGFLTDENYRESQVVHERLLEIQEQRPSGVFVDTMISPSMRSALAQTLQAPGIAGVENNTVLFEFSVHDPAEVVEEVREGVLLAQTTRMDTLVLRHGDHHFGNRASIHIWLTWHDYRNASLMILLAYILLGHPDWDEADLSIFAAFPDTQVKERTAELMGLIEEGRIAISGRKLQVFPTDDRIDFSRLVEAKSADADLVLMGFTEQRLSSKGSNLLLRHPNLNEILWVSARESIAIE